MKRALVIVVLIVSLAAMVWWNSSRTGKPSDAKTRIGVLMPLSGPVAEPGKKCLEGIELAVSQFNKLHSDHTVTLVIEDSKAEPPFALSAVQKLINVDKVPAIIGDLTSSVSMSVSPVTEKAQVILLSPGASHPKFIGVGSHTFRIWVSDNYDGEVMASYLSQDRKLKRGAVLYVNNDYGVGLAGVFKERFQQKGGRVAFYEGYSVGTTDFRPIIAKLSAIPGLEFIYLPGNPKENAFFVLQAQELPLKTLLAANLSVENDDFKKGARQAMKGIIFSSPAFDPGRVTLDGQPFIVAYRSVNQHEPDIASAHGYDAALALLTGWMNAGFDWNKTPAAITSLRELKGVTGTTSFTPEGDVTKSILVKELQGDGTATILKEIPVQ